MHVSKIAFAGFGPRRVNDPYTLDLPANGVVCVVGPNESGKSSLLEAVAYAVWGSNLREHTLVHEKGKSFVEVEASATGAEGVYHTVRRQSGSPRITLAGSITQTWDTLKPAAAAIEAVFGPLDLWLATSVFSTAERASDFCSSTDKFRKLLLETVLDVGVFDVALTRCREDLARARRALTAAESASRDCAQAVKSLEAELNVVTASVVSFTAADRATLAGLESDASDAQQAATAINRSIADLDVEARTLRYLDPGICRSCGQGVDPEYTARENARSLERRNAISAQRAALVASLASVWECCDEAEIQRLRALKRAAEAPPSTAVASTAAALPAAITASRKADATRDTARAEVAALEAVEQALGYKGIRARVARGAVEHLSTLASIWFQRIGGVGEIQVTLDPDSDTIDLSLTKVGGGAYKAGSSGIRRRVSIAVLLGLVDLVTAAHGRTGTLFFDEVFDSIDASGAAGVVAALTDVAVDRCCVVITHSSAIAAAFRRAGASIVNLSKEPS